GSHVAWNAAWKGELLEQALHPFFILRNVWVNLAVGPLEVSVGHKPRSAVTRAGDVDHVEVMLVDQPVQVDINEVQTRRRAPMTEGRWLDVFLRQRFPQQWVVVKVNLPNR